MDLQNYLKNIGLFDDIQKNKPELLNHPRIETLETNLLKSMDNMRPFVTSNVGFFKDTLQEFNKINNYFNCDECLAFKIEDKFTKNYSKILDDSVKTKYNNMNIVANQMLEGANGWSKYDKFDKEILNMLLNKLSNKQLNCKDIIQFEYSSGLSFTYSKSDRDYHLSNAYNDALETIKLDIGNYTSEKDRGLLSNKSKVFF